MKIQRMWGTMMLVLAAAATPAMAESGGSSAMKPAAAPSVANAPTVSDDDLYAALADPTLLAADAVDGPMEAPMPDGGGGDGGGWAHGGRRGMDGGMGMHGHGGPGGEMGMHDHLARVAQRLGLTDQQKERMHAILLQQTRRGIQERADIQLANLDLRQLMHADSPNLSAIDAQVDKVARMRATLTKERIGTMMQMHALLTPEQKSKLKEMMQGGMRDGDDGGGMHEHGGMH